MRTCFGLLILIFAFFCKLHGAATLERWFYCPKNLWVDKNIDELELLWRRAAKAGYSHVLLVDSKFGKLSDMSYKGYKGT